MDSHRLDNVIYNMISNCADFVEKEAIRGRFEPKKNGNRNQNLQDGNNSIQLYGSIIYEDKNDTTHESKPVMIKLTSQLWYKKFSTAFSFINELNFFTKIVPAMCTLDLSFASLFPKFYHGEMIFNVNMDQSVIIFEDLTARGYKMHQKRSFIDYEHLALMMRKLGQFHAYSYKAKKSAPNLFSALVNTSLESNLFVNKDFYDVLPDCGQRGLDDLSRDLNYKQYVPKIQKMVQSANEIYIKVLTGERKNPVSVIAHGDFLRNNAMFKYKNQDENGCAPLDAVMIDMATHRYGSPVIDLATILYLSADQETRDKYWDSLLDEYYAALKHTFGGDGIPTKNEILSEFIDKSFYAYLTASIFLQLLIGADDNTLPDFSQASTDVMSREKLIDLLLTAGGDRATVALSDILKDMIDRGFICN